MNIFYVLLLLGLTANLQAENKFIKALIMVESHNNVNAVGDNGLSWGCLQIRQGVVTDVNRIAKTNYNHKDVFKKNIAIKICLIYLRHYGKIFQKKTGKKITCENLARIWNGGPNGNSKQTTIKYWKLVKQQIREI